MPRIATRIATTLGDSIATSLAVASTTAATSNWDKLKDSVSTITPRGCFYADSSFLALDGSNNVSGWSCAWALGNVSAAQGTAARRPNFDGTDVAFDASNTEYLDLTIAEAAGDFTVLCGMTVADNGGDPGAVQIIMQTDDGTPVVKLMLFRGAGDLIGFDTNTDANQDGNANGTGLKYFTFELKGGGAGNASMRINAVASAAKTYTQTALGDGDAAHIGRSASATQYMNSKLRFFALYSGVDSTDTTAIEAIAAAILGL